MYENVRKCLELLPVSYHLYRMARRALDDNEKAQLMWFLKTSRDYFKRRYNIYEDKEKVSFTIFKFLVSYYSLIVGKFKLYFYFSSTSEYKRETTKDFFIKNIYVFEKEFNNVLHS